MGTFPQNAQVYVACVRGQGLALLVRHPPAGASLPLIVHFPPGIMVPQIRIGFPTIVRLEVRVPQLRKSLKIVRALLPIKTGQAPALIRGLPRPGATARGAAIGVAGFP